MLLALAPRVSRIPHPAPSRYLLSPKTTQVPLELRRSPRRVIREALRPRLRPQLPFLALRLRCAFGVALVDPLALGLLEPILEIRPTRLVRLTNQVLIGSIQVGVV